MNQKNVAIFGATGAQGAPVVNAAIAAGLTVRAVARDVQKISNMHPDATAFAADLSNENDVFEALSGVESAFVHLPMAHGPDDAVTWLGVILKGAERAGLPLLVFSTSGPAGDRYASSAVIDGKTAAVEAVLASSVPTIILQPAIYLENLQVPVFLPRLRSEGILDYPTFAPDVKASWTSHMDQALVAAAALTRPDLAGNVYEIGSPNALTGHELAQILAKWVDRSVAYQPMTAGEFGQRVGDVLHSPGAAFALSDLYGALGKAKVDELAIDTNKLEEVFGIKLTTVEDHIASWPKN